jgi:hypothetical protein
MFLMESLRWPSITEKCELLEPHSAGILLSDGLTSLYRSRQKPNLQLQVEVLPPNPDDPEFVKSLNETPGILALAMKRKTGRDGKLTFEGIPFVVPGARFNEVSQGRYQPFARYPN